MLELTYRPVDKYEFLGAVLTRNEFVGNVRNGAFIDYDGFGYALKSPCGCHVHAISNEIVKPSQADELPPEVTHIAWYNR